MPVSFIARLLSFAHLVEPPLWREDGDVVVEPGARTARHGDRCGGGDGDDGQDELGPEVARQPIFNASNVLFFS